MDNRRNFKVGDHVTLAGNTKLSGQVAGITTFRIGIRWTGRSVLDWYASNDFRIIHLDQENIIDRVMKKYHGYGIDSI